MHGRREGGSKGWTSALPAVVAATSLFLWLKAKIVELSLSRENRLLPQLLQLIGGFLDLPTEKERRQLRRREGGNKKKVKE